MKKRMVYSIFGLLFHCLVIFLLAKKFEHGSVSIWSLFYLFTIFSTALLSMFLFKKRDFGLGLLISVFLFIALFLLLQIIIIFCYQ